MLALIFANLVLIIRFFVVLRGGIEGFFSFDILGIQKKFEKFADGNEAEFKESYAFFIDNDDRIIDICHHGYQCTETSFNVLGKYTSTHFLLISNQPSIEKCISNIFLLDSSPTIEHTSYLSI